MRANPGVVLRGDRNECPGCGLLFSSTAAFSKHRVGTHSNGERRCLTPVEMSEQGFYLHEDGFWRGSRMPEQVLAKKSAE